MLMDSSPFPWRWATFPLAGDVIVPALVVCRNTEYDMGTQQNFMHNVIDFVTVPLIQSSTPTPGRMITKMFN